MSIFIIEYYKFLESITVLIKYSYSLAFIFRLLELKKSNGILVGSSEVKFYCELAQKDHPRPRC